MDAAGAGTSARGAAGRSTSLTHRRTGLDHETSPFQETFVRELTHQTALVTGASRGIGPTEVIRKTVAAQESRDEAAE